MALVGDSYEYFDPRFRAMTVPQATVETLHEGNRWAEGPVWFNDLGCLIWSDIPNNRMLRWTPDTGVGTCGKEGQSVPVGVGQPTLKIDTLTVGGTEA